jgi:putative SOS response-associated peptidase YedK
MCGRFTLRTPQNVLVQQFLLESIPDWKPRYNIAPTQPLLCVRREPGEAQREAVNLHWGLVPCKRPTEPLLLGGVGWWLSEVLDGSQWDVTRC